MIRRDINGYHDIETGILLMRLVEYQVTTQLSRRIPAERQSETDTLTERV